MNFFEALAAGSQMKCDASVLLDLARHHNKAIRSEAIALIWAAKDETVARAFVAGGWSHVKDQDQQEALCGTLILCKYGTHLPLDALRQRIVPQALPHLVQERGCNETELRAACDYVLELLNGEIAGKPRNRHGYMYIFDAKDVWKKIVEMAGSTVIQKTREIMTRGYMVGFFNIFPLVELVGAILEVSPADGIEIWALAKATQSRNGVSMGDFDNLALAKSDHAELASLRQRTIDMAKNDAELAQAAFMCLHNGHEHWLIKIIEADLGHDSAGRIARGLTLAGFLDCSDEAARLWSDEIETRALKGWLEQVRGAARRAYQRNIDARHWFEQYFGTTDPDCAFGYLNLYADRADLRSLLWAREAAASRKDKVPHVWLEHLDVKAEDRKNRRKKIEDQRKRTLYATDISANVHPWL